MDKPLLLVDFDRTLFDTGAFVDALWSAIAVLYGVDKDGEIARAKQFYTYQGDWYDYDFFSHIGSIPTVPNDSVVLQNAVHKQLVGWDFLYPDASTLIDSIDAIVTFGNEPYQRFKLSFCPQLGHIPTHIIQTGKGTFIREQFGLRPAVLVDDKRLEHELPESVQFIHLDRSQKEEIVAHGTYSSVNSLAVIASLHHENAYDRMKSL